MLRDYIRVEGIQSERATYIAKILIAPGAACKELSHHEMQGLKRSLGARLGDFGVVDFVLKGGHASLS